MNPTRRLLAFLPLVTLLAVAGCQKYAAAEVRRGIDLPAGLIAPKAPPSGHTALAGGPRPGPVSRAASASRPPGSAPRGNPSRGRPGRGP